MAVGQKVECREGHATTQRARAKDLTRLQAPDRNAAGLTTGVANIMNCAGVTERDRAVIVTDKKTRVIGEKLKEEAGRRGAKVGFIFMEDLGKRPLTVLPPETAEVIRKLKPTVSFFAATMQPGELGFRKPLIGLLLGEFKVRHVHMPGVNEELVGGEAMCANYDEVYRVTHAVLEAVNNARVIRVTTHLGTDITVELDAEHKELKWHACDGRIQTQGMFSNLPDGEVFTSPLNVNGKFVTTLLGDYFSEKYGVLGTPVTIDIRNGRALSVECKNKIIGRELSEYFGKGENTDRVGEFAIGTNISVTRFIGNMLADEKAKGVHMAFGDPLEDETGAKWTVNPLQHCDMVTQGCTIEVDGRIIMKEGNFLV